MIPIFIIYQYILCIFEYLYRKPTKKKPQATLCIFPACMHIKKVTVLNKQKRNLMCKTMKDESATIFLHKT